MAQTDELKKARKKRNKRRFARRVAAMLLALIIILAAVYTLRGGALRVVSARVADGLMAFLAGETLPAPLNMNRPVWAADLSGRIAISDGTTLAIYSKAGRQLSTRVLGYQSPAFFSSGGRVLSCDIGANRFELYFWGDRLFSAESEGAIYCAALGPNGNVAIGGRSESAQSGVWVYNEEGRPYFRWSSSELMVSAVALGGGGEKLAFAGISTEGGEVYSAINLYNIDKEDPTARVTLPGEAAAAISYCSDGVVVISDHRVSLIDEKGKIKAVYNYTEPAVAFSISQKGEVALLTGNFSESGSQRLTLLRADLKSSESWQLDSEAEQLIFSGSHPFVVAGEQLWRFSPGEPPKATRLPDGVLALPGSEVYFLTPTHLRKVAASA